VAGIFWRVIFDTHFGIANGILVGLGFIREPINWLQDTGQAVVIAIIGQAWRGVPLLAVLILAALKTIPGTLYRAAKMDGATTWEAFRFITLPAIRPTLIVVGILQIIVGLQVFDFLFTLTNGGPGRATYVLIYAIYDLAFQQLSFGYGSAVTVLLFFMIVLTSFLLLIFQVRRRRNVITLEDEDAELAAASARTSLRLERVKPLEGAATRTWADSETPRRKWVRISPRVSRYLFGIGAGALLLFFVLPIAWIVIASLQTDEALSHMPPQVSLQNLWLDGYTRIIQSKQWQGSLVVSLLTAILTTISVIVLASPAAYALARFQLPGKRAVLAVLIFTQMVPAIVMAIPVLKIFQLLGLTDTVAALVIVNTAFWLPLQTWLLRNFFAEVPVSLERAARIDGCSRLGTLFRVTVPAARPGIAAAAILMLIGTWNEFLFAVILGNHNAVTITRLVTVITAFPFRLNESPPPDLLAAGGLVAVIPCLILVLLFHRRIISGLTDGLVKG
jgi:multiple sugar transport system permease protein